MVGTLRTWPAHRWLLTVRRPQREAFTALLGAERALGVAALSTIALALIVGALLARAQTRPIEALVALTRAYASRDFSVRSTVRTRDEFEALGTSMEQMADAIARDELEISRRQKVEASLSRYLPAEVARGISEGRGSIELGGQRRVVTVLFADVVSFTTFAERAAPERVVTFLNELFTTLTEVVFRHGGSVDKFMGDCVMAICGAPRALDDHCVAALRGAEDMHRFVEANAPLWKKSFGVDVKLGIGVHTGEALLGNLGSEQRMEYTAIGDVVNVAARLEALASPGRTLCTRSVIDAAGDAVDAVSLGPRPLRGRADLVELYEVAE